MAASQPSAIHFLKADVSSAEDWKSVVETCVRDFGRVDVLVNNAGTSYPNKVSGIFRLSCWSRSRLGLDLGLCLFHCLSNGPAAVFVVIVVIVPLLPPQLNHPPPKT